MADYTKMWEQMQGLLGNALMAPARGYLAQSPHAPMQRLQNEGGLLGRLAVAADPVNALGGYGGLLAMALPPGKPLNKMPQMRPRVFWRGTNPGSAQRIKTGNKTWDSHLFAADNKEAATSYGKQLTKVEALPDAKILYEGTKDFVKVAGKWRKGESLLDYSARAAEAAKAAGYDAVWFKRQGDVGTAIVNPSKFKID